eukprot:scaffold6_cov245-Pinguiococcus_pyrenoidosus.AAC.5
MTVMILVQSALSYAATGQAEMVRYGKKLARDALQMHKIVFGGGRRRFMARYRAEFQLNIRSYDHGAEYVKKEDVEKLWPSLCPKV